MKILIDNGHGEETKGKRSPDGSIKEWIYTREIAAAIVKRLKSDGYDAELLVPETRDVSLSERCDRVNSYCAWHGAENCLLISVHLNACGNGSWMNAEGWQVCVSLNASYNSRLLAGLLYDEAKRMHFKVRRPTPVQKYWHQDLMICRDTYCPAVLTENLFMDNIDDVRKLEQADVFNSIVNIHVAAIIEYILLK